MRHSWLIFFFLITVQCSLFSQSEDCNELGAWVWHLELTGMNSHSQLAKNLSGYGIKRAYVKVSDGRVDTSRWTEMVDHELVEAYKDQDLQIWGWSYNYVGNDSLQAQALYHAAKSGYDGYVIDVEMEFDGNPLGLFNLFFAFDQAKQRALNEGLIDENFKVYCTTWGNPKDHNYSISVIDPYVDAFMPQTYVEQWGLGFITNLEYWIDQGNMEYIELGATKPIHHIVAMQDEILIASDVNRFIPVSGPETSVWRVPGGSIPIWMWEEWRKINWDYDFCGLANVADDSDQAATLKLYPNPTSDLIHVVSLETNSSLKTAGLYSSMGKMLDTYQLAERNTIDLSGLPAGLYLLKYDHQTYRILKI